MNVILADPITGVASCRTRAECLAAQDPSLVFARENEIDLDFFRIFGHADWEVTDQITIGGGVAYYESDQRDPGVRDPELPGFSALYGYRRHTAGRSRRKPSCRTTRRLNKTR